MWSPLAPQPPPLQPTASGFLAAGFVSPPAAHATMDGPTPSAYTCSLPPTAPQCRVPADGSPGADSCCEEAGSPGAPTAEDVCMQSPISNSPLLDRLSTGGDRTGVEKGAVARARASLWGEPAAAEAEAPPPCALSEMEDEVPPMSPHVTMRSPQRRQRMVQTFEAEPAAAPPTAPAAKPPLRKGMSGFQMAGFLSPAEAEAKAAAMAAAEADAAAEAESKVALEAESKEMAAAFWAAHADQEAAAAVSRRWAVAGAVVVAGASVAALVAARPDDARRAAAAVVVAGAHAHGAIARVLARVPALR